ncbi:NADAR family protein [Ruminiclostridium cellobioparum]|uniref:NADAR domain-containing protein n=1 Tax=Ruminiclostridium cellobioparum subsp. termitidis CT1112 TaxID=1195236 RepID=S0FJV9_RUMCE|nr:NADAR family protein [Ruminiclostridium cellobioparum]EMS72087.1 hypothetical protein CTER_2047 [Ruminiclostridium cellobioparum subsp. termitidis CT1112]
MNIKYDINNPMAPLWFMYPHIGRYSIGWRMGYGENFAYEFGNWYSSLSKEEQKQYQDMFPTPVGWHGWYEEEYTNEDYYDDDYLLWNKDGKMTYTLDSLCDKYKRDIDIEYVFFWGHQPSKDGSITKSCFSQWWKSDFIINIDKYCCMEQYMMAEKARLFQDTEVLKKIMDSTDPKQIKELGRKVKNFKDDIWEKKRYSIILNGNYAKFTQNEDIKQFLLQTKNKVLVEASPYDKIWGIGMIADDEKVENPFEWKGQNLLGFALMEVRDEIARIYKNHYKLNLNELHEEFD